MARTPPKVYERTTSKGRKRYFVRTRDALDKQTSEVFDTKTAAQAFARQVAAVGGPTAIALLNKRDPAADEYVPTVAEWLEKHVKQLTGVTERTRKDYVSMANRTWLPAFGPLGLDDITRDLVADEVNRMDKSGLSAKSIANTHGFLVSMLNSAVQAGHITSNPAHRMRLPRSREEERDEPRFLTFPEYEALLEATTEHYRPLVALLFGSGLRWSEATALTVGDVIGGKMPAVRVTKAWKATPGKSLEIGPPKSPKSRRTALLSPKALDMLDLDRPKSALLLVAVRGGTVHHGLFRDRVWLPAARDAGLASPYKKGTRYDGPRIHDARHSHASWLISNGATLEMVQDQLGHESILTTRKIYGHLLPETQNRLAAALAQAMGVASSEPAGALEAPGT